MTTSSQSSIGFFQIAGGIAGDFPICVVPMLHQVFALRTPEIRALFESHGLMLHDWERARTDRVMIQEAPAMAV